VTHFFRMRWGSLLHAQSWTLFRPILSGATLRSRLIACAGAALGIGLTGLICGLATGRGFNLPLLVAPMGTSSVLVFAVPTSPLAQPWPAIGGNIISAMIGVVVAYLVPQPVLAAGLAAGLAIAAMSFTRSLHPPGGAAALVAAFGGSSATGSDFWFPLFPVGVNACLLVACGWAFHKLARNSYPHRPPAIAPSEQRGRDIPATQRVGFKPQDIDAALEQLGEAFDISRADLDVVIREVETQALIRDHGDLTCADIMSRDVVHIHLQAVPMAARALLVAHDIRDLPVIDDERRVLGSVGLRQLGTPAVRVADMMVTPVTATAETRALGLIRLFTTGQTRTVIIVDDEQRLVGVVTQTDLLAAMSRGLSQEIRRGVAA
jgi:CBS domain-containing membrane protein